MKLPWFSLLRGILFLCLIEIVKPLKCIDTKKCSCSVRPPRYGLSQNNNYYEFQCPPNLFDTGGVIIHAHESGTRIEIECHKSTHFDSYLFPKLDVGNITWIDIKKHCPLPRSESFEKMIRKFTATKPLALAFERMLPSEEPLSKNHFSGLITLKGLSLRFDRLQELDEDVFANTPALTMINLQDNKIRTLKSNIFKFTPELKELDISLNEIERFSEGFFSSLTKLQLLILWNNRLEGLDETIFKGLKNLTVLQLSVNKIGTIAAGSFADLAKLTNLSLSSNQIGELPTDLFAKNELLEEVLLDYNPNLTLPEYTFGNLRNLRKVGMSHCNLSSVPANLFNGSTSLRELNLDGNRLESLPEGFLQGLGELTELNLDENFLKVIPNSYFGKLTKLAVLTLEHNFITEIYDSAFPESLRKLSLAHNSYDFGANTPFVTCVNLELLDLSHNLITAMRYDFVMSLVKLKELILSHNLISEVDFLHLSTVSGGKIFLQYNNITNINFYSAKISAEQQEVTNRNTEVYLEGNPIKCDCDAYDLALYVQDKLHRNLKALVHLVPEEIVCATPKNLGNQEVEKLPLEELSCPLEGSEHCPDNCLCSYEPHEDKVVYDCGFKNLTHIPDLPERNYTRRKVLLQGNQLRRGPDQGLIGWSNVTELNLTQNMIQDMTWIPVNLQVLTLDYNHLGSLPYTLLESLNISKIEGIRLGHNPWKCDCGSLNLTNFLRRHSSRLNDTEDIRCKISPHNLLTNLHKHNLCKEQHPSFWLWILIAVLAIDMLVLIFWAFYYKHENDIKVWLYAKNLCLCWVTEQDLDKDETSNYDIYLSYAPEDEDFVVSELVPKLEWDGYKLCLPYRDWPAYGLISDNVKRSVNSSRRTLVVLSSNYFKSAQYASAFKLAHQRTMGDKMARVAVVLKGQMSETDLDDLDEDLKSYIKMHRYVKWGGGGRWFWKKLRYVLPHRRRPCAIADC